MSINEMIASGKPDEPLTRADVERLLNKVGSSALLNLSRQNMRGIDLNGFNLNGANLSEADLSKANLDGADLNGAHLIRARLNGAHLIGARLSGADLSGADLSGTYLIGADLRETILSNAYLRKADLRGTTLSGAELRRVYLIGANLSGANLSGADLGGANLSGADLSEADLSGAYLIGTDLSGVNLGRVILRRANLRRANLRRADLSEVDLNEVDLNGAMLSWFDQCRMVLLRIRFNIGQLFKVVLLRGRRTNRPLPAGTVPSQNQSRDDRNISSSIEIRVNEEPLTAQKLTAILSAFVELHTKSWLIQQGRFQDFVEYDRTKDPRFEKDAKLFISKLKYNSPAEIKFNVDLSPESVINALKMALDSILHIRHRLKAAELDNLDKELDVKKKALELDKQRIEYALEIAGKMVDQLQPGVDEEMRATFMKGLLPPLLNLGESSTVLEIIPPNVQDNKKPTIDVKGTISLSQLMTPTLAASQVNGVQPQTATPTQDVNPSLLTIPKADTKGREEE